MRATGELRISRQLRFLGLDSAEEQKQAFYSKSYSLEVYC